MLVALPFVWLATRRRQLGNTGKVALFIGIWLLSHSAFNWFWDPGFNKYWLVPLVCVWAAAALALDQLQKSGSRLYRPALGAAIILVGLSFLLNWTTQFLPQSNPDNNPWLRISAALSEQSRPNDLFVSAGTSGHPMDFYLVYFGRRDVLSAGLVTYDVGGDSTEVGRRLSPRLTAHRDDGGKIYVYGLEDMTADEKDQFVAAFGSGATLTPMWTFPELTIYEVVTST